MSVFKIGDVVRIKNAYKLTANTGIPSEWFDEFGDEEFIITNPNITGTECCLCLKTGEISSYSFNFEWLELVNDIKLRENIIDDFEVFLNG